MNGAGVVQPLAPEPAPVATVTEPDDNGGLIYEIELLELTLEIVEDLKTINAIQKELELLYLTIEVL